MRELLRRIHYLLNRRRFDDELKEEMAFHREMADTHGGVPLGDALRLREDSREAWGVMWLDRFGQDLRYAFQAMRRSPGFTAAAVLVLAVGIGATVAAFSAFNMAALRPLPVRDPETILRFQRHAPGRTSTEVPYRAVAFYREHARTLSAVLAQTASSLSLKGAERSPSTFFVTANFFDELGARPGHGRLFTADDARPDAPPAVVLGHGFWASHFGSDPSVVGTSAHLNGKAVTIIGVVAREFSGLAGDAPAFWALVEHHGYFVHGSRLLTDFSSGVTMWGRLGPGASPQMAEAELAALAAELRRQHPGDIWEDERLLGEPGGYAPLTGATSMFALVGALVLLILAVACGNLGSLLLARGASRRREMALRSAIGAGTGRLIRQLFTESLVLAVMGCLGGLALGSLVLKGIMVSTEAPPWLDPTPDWRVVTFAIAMGFLSSVLFGLAPALQIARQKQKKTVGRTMLIGVQVASSCVLLIVAGLLVRAAERAASTDPGFEYEHVIVVEPSLSEHGYTAARARTYIQDLSARLRGIAGVEDLSLTSTPPLGDRRMTSPRQLDGRALDVYIHQVDPQYLTTMKIPLLRGRNLIEGDDRGVVVSESLARRNWPDRDPLGQPFKTGNEALTVVGIAGNARSLALGDPDAVELYRLARERDLTEMTVVARTSGPTEALAPAFSAAANGIDPNLRPRVHLLKDQFHQNVREIERGALAVSVLGVIALAVACLGVLGLVAYSVAQHTKEIGIRMALGARPGHILASLSSQFRGTIIGGLVLGVLGAAGLAQLLRRELYGLSTIDPIAYISAIILFLIAVGLAALWPARRALRVDPLVALRCD
ncbi:MAG TPA: ABC transporter permease [Vicinamibacterales bacterium]|nr:ABC transporter permease [Vicinamibacterales bacterium]